MMETGVVVAGTHLQREYRSLSLGQRAMERKLGLASSPAVEVDLSAPGSSSAASSSDDRVDSLAEADVPELKLERRWTPPDLPRMILPDIVDKAHLIELECELDRDLQRFEAGLTATEQSE